MKKSYRVLIVCTLLLVISITGIGYAQVTDSLTVNGSVGVKGWDIYISNIGTATLSSNRASCTVNGYENTPFLSTQVTLPAWTSGTSPSVTIPVTIQNDTKETVQYIGILKATHDNTNIQVNVTAAASETDLTIAPKGSTTVNVTFSYVNTTWMKSTLNSYFKFNFLPRDTLKPSSGAVNDPASVFLNDILNGEGQTRFDALYQGMSQTEHAGDEAHQIRDNSSFIGMVPLGPEADNNLLNLLFDGNNTRMNIDGGKTVDIKGILIATNSDNDIASASTIYFYVITDANFGTYPNTDAYSDSTYETYLAAYNRTDDNKWEQATIKVNGITADSTCGMVKGQAPAVVYSGNGGITDDYRNSIWSNNFYATANGTQYGPGDIFN